MAGAATQVKALRAIMHLPKIQFELWLHGTGDYTADGGITSGQSFNRSQAGYEVTLYNLGCDTYHLVAKSRRAGFMPNLSAESVWQEIASPRFTTPVIREWADYVMARMVEKRYIQKAKCFGCDCGYMVADDKQLDDIVKRGLLDRDITIR